jgi:hypothetical protein
MGKKEMRYILIILFFLLLSSCISYKVQTRQPELRTVLGVTTQGDTIQVPMDYFQDRTPKYNYDLEYFFWRDNWWLYNQRLYNRGWWDYQPYWGNGFNQIIIPRQQPRYIPREQPQRRTPTRVIQSNRGRNNQSQVRRPQYNRATPPPTTSNRNSTVRRSNNNARKQN